MHGLLQPTMVGLLAFFQAAMPTGLRTNVERLNQLENEHRVYREKVDLLERKFLAADITAQLNEAQRVLRTLGAVGLREVPIVLDREGMYTLQQDLVFAGDAFVLLAKVEVNLNGHTVIYGVRDQGASAICGEGRAPGSRIYGGQLIQAAKSP